MQEGLLIDPGRDILFIFSTSSKVESQSALLLSHTVYCLYDIVTPISLTRFLQIEKSWFMTKSNFIILTHSYCQPDKMNVWIGRLNGSVECVLVSLLQLLVTKTPDDVRPG